MSEVPDEIVIISAPEGRAAPEIIANLTLFMKENYRGKMPVYITPAKLHPVTKDEIMHLLQELTELCKQMGWLKFEK